MCCSSDSPSVHRSRLRALLRWACTLAAALALAAPSLADESARGELALKVRDAWTGAPVTARVELYRADDKAPIVLDAERLEARFAGREPAASAATARVQPAVLPLAAGRYVLAAEAEGYRPLYSYTGIEKGALAGATLWLDPTSVPERLSAEAVAAAARDGHALFHGHVYDGDRGTPVAGARVALAGAGVQTETETETADDGYFRLYAPLAGAPLPDAAPEAGEALPAATLRVEAPGFKAHVASGVLIAPGDRHFVVDLVPGSGERRVDARDKLQLTPDELVEADRRRLEPEAGESSREAEPIAEGPIAGGEGSSSLAEGALQVHNPPDSIRVGYADAYGTTCCTGGCYYSSTFSLETYVRRGLTDEWISSWGQDSLRSGAPAYRAYGAWHVYNPKSGSYDICSNACCQVNDADTSTSGNTATDRTSGIMLQLSGGVFRSEYSAENNSWNDPNDGLSCVNSDLSCGDGYVGSPATGWPCLYDVVAIGRGCFGHGRGMSQWGTYRWDATYGKDWRWISDHYYNAGGNPSGNRSAYLTSPIQIDAVSPSPAAVNAGGSFTIDVSLTSWAEVSHAHVILGASLVSGGTTVTDPGGDAVVTIAPGGNSKSRGFTVPGGTASGTYDLVVGAWLDVDENGAIGAADLELASFTSAGAVSVGGGGVPRDATVDEGASSVPSSMQQSATQTVTVRVQNTGTNTWTAGSAYRLGAGSGNTVDWSSFGCGGYANSTTDARVYLCSSVAPGATHDFTFDITAPASGSSAVLEVQMVQDGVAWFGEKQSFAITLTAGGWSDTIDDSDPDATLYGPAQYWWPVSGYGVNNQMHYTWNEQTSGSNYVYWYFDIPSSGSYTFEAFIPSNHATTTSAKYWVWDGSIWHGPYTVNQNAYYDQWVTLGTVSLTPGTRVLYLGDVTGEASGTRKIGVDAARATRQ